MKKIIILSIVTSVFLMAMPHDAHAFWVWSRKHQTWRNPQMSALSTPSAQLAYAQELYAKGKISAAFKEFKKVIVNYKDSKEAPEAQFFLGKCWEDLKKPLKAFKAYKVIVESYPYSTRISEGIKQMYGIAEAYIARTKKKVLGIQVDVITENPAIEIFQFIIDNAPYSEEAKASQYKLGMLFKELGRFNEAIEQFKDVIDKYPESRWYGSAKYELARCSSAVAPSQEYDQELAKEAKQHLTDFIVTHPEAEIAEDAQKEVATLTDKEAEKMFSVAQFYEKQKNTASAKVYYKNLIAQFPDNAYAAQAQARIQALEGDVAVEKK